MVTEVTAAANGDGDKCFAKSYNIDPEALKGKVLRSGKRKFMQF